MEEHVIGSEREMPKKTCASHVVFTREWNDTIFDN
jgi:hypothetical protein